MPSTVDVTQHDRFLLKQKFSPMANRYEFRLLEPGQTDADGEVVLFVQQKRMKLKEDIRFFAGDGGPEVMRFKAKQVFDPRAKYTITDAHDQPIGELQKQFGASLLRSTYTLFDAAGQETAIAQERSQAMALVRRFADVPFIPYHFDFSRGADVLATNERVKMKMRDTYIVDCSADTGRTLDRRLVLATCVGMDALQAR